MPNWYWRDRRFHCDAAQRSRNETMKHEAMPDHASFDVIKLPKSIYVRTYSDYVISVCFYEYTFAQFAIYGNNANDALTST